MPSREHAESEAAPDPDLLDEVTRAIAKLESHEDPAVRAAAQQLLAGIDAVHRAGLTHLVQAIQGVAGEAFLNRLLGDPAIRLLLMSYNLVAVDRRLQAEEALDPVRGHLHDHGVDVEITEVVGGVVYVRLHPSHRAGAAPPPARDDIRRDLEAALREGLLGFQELVLRDRADASALTATIPLAALRHANRPVYVDAAPADLARGELRPVRVNDVPILLVRIDGDVHAIRNQCGDGPLPLEFGTLDEESVLRCSWHGCRYDVRTGKRLDEAGDRVQVYPVSIENGRIRVALAVEPALRDAS